jgi:hypothetical protein
LRKPKKNQCCAYAPDRRSRRSKTGAQNSYRC